MSTKPSVPSLSRFLLLAWGLVFLLASLWGGFVVWAMAHDWTAWAFPVLLACVGLVFLHKSRRLAKQRMTVERFVEIARGFSAWCVAPQGDSTAEAHTALRWLLQLLQGIHELPEPASIDYDLEGERSDNETWSAVYARAANALPFQNYGSVFDPQELPPSASVGDLADDIADIHRDLFSGLSLYDRGHVHEAVYDFRLSYHQHWGRHVAWAVAALADWCREQDRWG